MAFRIHKGVWQFAKPDGSYESKYKINDSGELVTTDADGNEQGSLMSNIAEADTLATVTSRGASTTSGLYINNNNPTLYLQDTDNRSAMIHVNSNYFYLLNGSANNSTGWAQQANSRWLFQGNLNNNDITFGGSGDFAGTVTASGGNSSQWNTAYGWGNHSGRYMTQGLTLSSINTISNGGNRYDPSTNNPTNEHYAVLTYGNGGNVTGQLATHYVSGNLYSRGYNSSWSGWRRYWNDTDFTSTNVTNWNTAYGWGNHASAGYLTSLPSHSHSSISSGVGDITIGSATWTKNNGEAYVAGQVYNGQSGDSRFMFHSGAGVVNVYTDGNFYAVEGTQRVATETWVANRGYITSVPAQSWASITGKPTNLSQFTNDLGNYGGWLTTSGKAADSNLLDGIDSGSFLRSDTNDSFTGLLTATASDWYIYGLGARGASAGAYGIGNRAADSYRQMTFHVPNLAAYSGSGTIPSFGWYSNGAVQLMKLDSDSGNLWTKGTIEADGRIYADDGLHVRGNWVRVNGSQGLYFESYGGGWHMTDSTWIRSYNSKPIYVDQYVRADQGFEVSGHRVIGNDKNVNAYSKVQIGGFTIQQNAAGDLEFVF